MERSMRERRVAVQACLMALLVALGVGARVGEQKETAENRSAAAQVPLFEIDPLWPKPLPNH
jgi:hypothetical protein